MDIFFLILGVLALCGIAFAVSGIVGISVARKMKQQGVEGSGIALHVFLIIVGLVLTAPAIFYALFFWSLPFAH